MERISPPEFDSPTFDEGGDFYLPPAGAEGLGNQSSGGGNLFKREDTMDELIDGLIDELNRDTWEGSRVR